MKSRSTLMSGSMSRVLSTAKLLLATAFGTIYRSVASCCPRICTSLVKHKQLVGLCHPAIDTRDVALFLPFHRNCLEYEVAPLKHLVGLLMRRRIEFRHEDSVRPCFVSFRAPRSELRQLEKARATMDLYRSYEEPWEEPITAGFWPSALPPTSYQAFFC